MTRSTRIIKMYKGTIFIQTNTETGISCSPVLRGTDTFCGEIGNISMRLFMQAIGGCTYAPVFFFFEQNMAESLAIDTTRVGE